VVLEGEGAGVGHVSRSPSIVMTNVFHSPRGRSARVVGVTPARTSDGIVASVR